MINKWSFEIVSWLLTAALTAAILLPIYQSVPEYPFWIPNIVFIVTLITLTRFIFLLPHTFLAKRQWLKGACVFLSIPLIFYLIQEINYFQTFLDEEGIAAIVGELPARQQRDMIQYVRSEMLLFGVGSTISSVIFPFRMIQSIWLLHNRGRV